MGALVSAPHHARHHGQSEKDRLAEGEAMLRDRNAGMAPSEMLGKYGVSKATLYRRLDAAISARIAPTVDAYREQQNALLDDIMAKWTQQVGAAEMMIREGTIRESRVLVQQGIGIHAQALTGMLRVAERRSRLMGTDAPVRAEVVVTDATPNIDARVAALAEEIRSQAEAVA